MSGNNSRICCAAILASPAVTFPAALITNRRFDRSSSTAYMDGDHTKQAWSQVRHFRSDYMLRQSLVFGAPGLTTGKAVTTRFGKKRFRKLIEMRPASSRRSEIGD